MATFAHRASSEVTVDDVPVAEGTAGTSFKTRNGRLRQKLAIESSLVRNVHKCNQQVDSPLWNLLPLEIRYLVRQLRRMLCFIAAGLSGHAQLVHNADHKDYSICRSGNSPQHSMRICRGRFRNTTNITGPIIEGH
jgi:hypothetical protein